MKRIYVFLSLILLVGMNVAYANPIAYIAGGIYGVHQVGEGIYDTTGWLLKKNVFPTIEHTNQNLEGLDGRGAGIPTVNLNQSMTTFFALASRRGRLFGNVLNWSTYPAADAKIMYKAGLSSGLNNQSSSYQ